MLNRRQAITGAVTGAIGLTIGSQVPAMANYIEDYKVVGNTHNVYMHDLHSADEFRPIDEINHIYVNSSQHFIHNDFTISVDDTRLNRRIFYYSTRNNKTITMADARNIMKIAG